MKNSIPILIVILLFITTYCCFRKEFAIFNKNPKLILRVSDEEYELANDINNEISSCIQNNRIHINNKSKGSNTSILGIIVKNDIDILKDIIKIQNDLLQTNIQRICDSSTLMKVKTKIQKDLMNIDESVKCLNIEDISKIFKNTVRNNKNIIDKIPKSMQNKFNLERFFRKYAGYILNFIESNYSLLCEKNGKFNKIKAINLLDELHFILCNNIKKKGDNVIGFEIKTEMKYVHDLVKIMNDIIDEVRYFGCEHVNIDIESTVNMIESMNNSIENDVKDKNVCQIIINRLSNRLNAFISEPYIKNNLKNFIVKYVNLMCVNGTVSPKNIINALKQLKQAVCAIS